MKHLKSILAGVALQALLAVPAAHADAVTCAQPPGLRTLTISPGLVNGFCYGQVDNFQGNDFTAASNVLGTPLTMQGKEHGGSNDYSTIDYTYALGGLSGTWTVAGSLWDDHDRVFLAFHFGNGGSGDASNPDSFIVELARADLTGTWQLGGVGAKLNGISNIYVLTADDGTGSNNVPEPGSLALVGLALAGVGALSRRRKA